MDKSRNYIIISLIKIILTFSSSSTSSTFPTGILWTAWLNCHLLSTIPSFRNPSSICWKQYRLLARLKSGNLWVFYLLCISLTLKLIKLSWTPERQWWIRYPCYQAYIDFCVLIIIRKFKCLLINKFQRRQYY